MKTAQSYGWIWLAVTVAILFVFTVWTVFSNWGARRLDAEYCFSIIHLGMRTGQIRAFHDGMVAFPIPVVSTTFLLASTSRRL